MAQAVPETRFEVGICWSRRHFLNSEVDALRHMVLAYFVACHIPVFLMEQTYQKTLQQLEVKSTHVLHVGTHLSQVLPISRHEKNKIPWDILEYF